MRHCANGLRGWRLFALILFLFVYFAESISMVNVMRVPQVSILRPGIFYRRNPGAPILSRICERVGLHI